MLQYFLNYDQNLLYSFLSSQADKNVKALTYFDAVLSFILCGHTMENDPHIPGEKAVTMYNETCEIIK